MTIEKGSEKGSEKTFIHTDYDAKTLKEIRRSTVTYTQ